MITKDLTVANKLGLHARAAAKLVALASNFASEISLQKGSRKINGKSIMGVMMLAASQHTIVNIVVTGEDEQQAMTEIENLFTNLFDEEE
ncbi:MAG: HPr family phosphocarrier protein [Gammaproteobacteria bacterium]|nr:HPr family phosphocarrier protein [Gammaproteobacteria bacterium]MDH3607777.1 HPr family phosphocarrier protein [Gammaproteobacteria bacterium]NNC67832.1 HPr family phosphocarrier protein [Gammaproteobacteria bacterium]